MEQQLAEKTSEAEDPESRAGRAETRVAELESLVETEREAEATTTSEQVAELREAVREREEEIEKTRQELSDWEHRWDDNDRRHRADREAWLQQAELERYRALEEERRRHETRESRLYTRLEAVEEELRTTRATAADAGDDGPWREQVRILTSDLSTVRTLVGSLEAENSRLVQENERLNREDISVQQESAGLTTDQLTREREDVDMFGGQGTHAHQRMTTRRLDPGNPWVRE